MKTKHFLRGLFIKVMILLLPFWSGAQFIQISKGAHWVMNGPVNVVLKDFWLINNGVMAPGSSTVVFTGSLIQNYTGINGNSPTPFYNLTIDKRYIDPSSNNVIVQQDISAAGVVTMNSGNLLVMGHTLDLGKSGSITGEKDQSGIITNGGAVVVSDRVISGTQQPVNPGNIGLEITMNSENIVASYISRTSEPQTMQDGEQGIRRVYTLSTSPNMDLNAHVRCYYLDSELGGVDENGLNVWVGSDITAGWLQAGREDHDATGNWVSLGNIDHFNRLTLAGAGSNMEMRADKRALTTIDKAGLADSSGGVIKAQLYPNPSHGQFMLALSSDREKDEVAGLYDQSGHLLQQRKIHFAIGQNTISWDMSGYAAGVYYLSVGQGLKNVKIVKE